MQTDLFRPSRNIKSYLYHRCTICEPWSHMYDLKVIFRMICRCNILPGPFPRSEPGKISELGQDHPFKTSMSHQALSASLYFAKHSPSCNRLCIKQTREQLPAIPTFCTGEARYRRWGATRLGRFCTLIRRLPGYLVGEPGDSFSFPRLR